MLAEVLMAVFMPEVGSVNLMVCRIRVYCFFRWRLW